MSRLWRWLRGHHHIYSVFYDPKLHDWNEYGLRCRCGNTVVCESGPSEVR